MVIKIDKLDENTKNETIVVKILSLTEKETKSEKGEGVYHYGLIGDETGTMPYTAWALPATIRQGDVVELRNFSVKKYNDSLRLYLDTRTDVILRPRTVKAGSNRCHPLVSSTKHPSAGHPFRIFSRLRPCSFLIQ